MNTRVVTAHLPIELADKVDQWAALIDRPRGWIVKQALAEWVALEEERHRLTLEALADVDVGRTVDDERVQEWLDSLETDNPLPMPQA